MPAVGYLRKQSVIVEDFLPAIGTMIYEGTLISTGITSGTTSAKNSTIVGGVVLSARKLQILSEVAFGGVSQDIGSITGGRVLAFGKGLGTLIGTGVGTLLADTNSIIFQLFGSGTITTGGILGPAQPTAGSTIRGTIVAIERGM